MSADSGPIDCDELAAALPWDLALLALAYALPERLAALRQACGGGDVRVVRCVVACLAISPEEALAGVSGRRGSALHEASRRGHSRVVQWLVERFAPSGADVRTEDYDLLEDACRSGDLELVQWLVGRYGQTVGEPEGDLLAAAAEGGHVPLMQWLAAVHGKEADMRELRYPGRGCALMRACARGHLEAARWLADREAQLAPGARWAIGSACCQACSAGHLEVVQWLVGCGALGVRGGGRMSFEMALWDACVNGRLEVVQWLNDHFGISARTSRDLTVTEFDAACMWGQLAVARWLAEHFSLATECTRTEISYVLGAVCMHGQLETAQWLVGYLSPTAEEAQAAVDDARARFARGLGPLPVRERERNSAATVRWLAERFGLPCVAPIGAT